jgi:hypothetical protein
MRYALPLVLLLALSACGVKTDLKPQAGKALPPAPYGRADVPSATQLLQGPAQAAPARSIELRQRSEERADDPFDLPPQ